MDSEKRSDALAKKLLFFMGLMFFIFGWVVLSLAYSRLIIFYNEVPFFTIISNANPFVVMVLLIMGLMFNLAGFLFFSVISSKPKSDKPNEIKPIYGKTTTAIILFITIYWLVISFPIVFVLMKEYFSFENVHVAWSLLFPLIGLVFFVFFIRSFLKNLKFGKSKLVLDEECSLGGVLLGKVSISKTISPNAGFTISLKCTDTFSTGGSNNRTSSTITLHKDFKRTKPSLSFIKNNITEIPVYFDIPEDKPASGGGSQGHASWSITIEADVKGVDYSNEFVIPVKNNIFWKSKKINIEKYSEMFLDVDDKLMTSNLSHPSLKIKEKNGEILFSISLGSLNDKFKLVFLTIGWNSLSFFFLIYGCMKMIIPLILVGLLTSSIGCLIFYICLVALFSKIKIHLSKTKLKAWNGPIPMFIYWIKMKVLVNYEDIKKFQVKKIGSSRNFSYNFNIIKKDGSEVALMKYVNADQDLLLKTLEQNLNNYLQKENDE